MKIFNKYLFLLVASCFLLGACSDDDDFEPGPQASGEGFYFFDSGSNITLSLTDGSFDIKVGRSSIDDATSAAISSKVTVSITDEGGAVIDADASYLFDIPSSVSFSAGEASAPMTITYDPDEVGFDKYTFTLSLEGTGQTTPYGMSSYEFVAAAAEPWVSLGMATFNDYFFFYYSYQVELQQNQLYPDQYRLVQPYLEGLENPDEGYTDYAPFNGGEYLTFQILQPGQTLRDTPITMEGLVYFDPYDPGWYYDYYSSDVVLYHPSAFSGWQSESDWVYSKVASYADDGSPALVQFGPIYYLPNYGGYWDCHDDAYVEIAFPGVEVVNYDYSVSVSYLGTYTDTSDNVSAIGSFSLGSDVAYAEVAMAAGNDASSLLYGILDGTVESQVITSDCDLTFPLEDSGQYTIMIVSYDESGEAWEYDYVIFTYYASSSENPWTSLGYAEYTDDCITTFFYMYEEGDLAVPYDVEIQENNSQPGLYRLVNPYGEAYPFNDPGDWDTSQDYYLEINACDPEAVYFDAFDTGCDWGYGDFGIWSLASYYMAMGYSLEQVKAYGDCGTLVDGVITFPVEGLLVSMANYQGGGWFYGNLYGHHKIVLPSAREAKGKKSKSVVNTSGTKHFAAPSAKKFFDKGHKSVKTNSRTNMRNNVKARRTPAKAISLIK